MDEQKSRRTAESYWKLEHEAGDLIEHQMHRLDIRYKELSRMLEKVGIYESPRQINRKVLRRKFSAAFFFACMRAMGMKVLLEGKAKAGKDKTA